MSREYRKWPDLTPAQRAEAQKMALFIGYKPDEILSLLYGMDGETVVSMRDNSLLGDFFPTEPAKQISK